MTRRKIALRSLKDLCAFVGAVGLFSFFYNWTVDTRHWYLTLASAFVCSILWLGFYFAEVHKEVVKRVSVSLERAVSGWLSRLRTTEPELPVAAAPDEQPPELPELLWPKRFLHVC